MTLATLYFGGIASSTWTWSGIELPLDYLNSLVLAQLPEDLPYVAPDLAVDRFRLYFGVNTMWYLHIHFVWERL